MRNHSQQSNGRPAFTLIELLIVIAIIGVLAALSAGAYFYAMGRQYEKNTNATIEYVYGVYKQQWKHVIAEAKKEQISDTVKQLVEPDPSGERARVVWIMLRLAEAFPQTYNEIKTPVITLNGGSRKYSVTYESHWAKAGKPAAGKSLQHESAACLYLALSSQKGSAAISPEQLPVKGQLVGNGDLLGFYDAWGNPLAFFRFPYNYSRLSPASSQTICPNLSGPKGSYYNPLDPLKTLDSWSGTNKTAFETALNFKIGTWFTTPTIVSAGSDAVLDLSFPDMADGAAAKDNRFSFDILAP